MSHTTSRAFVAVAALLSMLCSACTVPTANGPDDGIPPEVSKYSADWPTANGDYRNARASTDSAIHSGNVATLGVAWTFDIPGAAEFGAAPTNPLILGDVVYLQDMKSNVFALDLQTGDVLWRQDYDMNLFGPEGVAVGWGKVFALKGHYEVAALDIETGEELWSTTLSDIDSVGIDIQVTTYDNLVYASTVPGTGSGDFYSGGGVGIIYALNQETGEVEWSWSTVDSEDIWGNPEVNSGGGAWYPPAIDVETGIMYWGIANPAPWPGTAEFPNGSSRPGPNLYSNSMVALDASSGELLWYNQVHPHDIFDLDFQISPVLATATVAGAQKAVVIGSGKLGTVYAFDRDSGDIYWETPVGQHQNDDLTELPPGTTRVLPGVLGGVETSMAFAGDTLYVPIVNLFSDFTPTALDASTLDIGAGTGELTALDIDTGDMVWTVEFDSMNVGGATVVNDTVFTSTLAGVIYAFDRATGKQLWSYQAAGGINGWPAAADDYILFPVGMGPQPQLVAFQLGKSPATPGTSNGTTTPTTPAPPAAGLPTVDGVISAGEYASSQVYDRGNYEVWWTSGDGNLYVAMKAKTAGFVSIGIQPGSMMKNADIVFGFVKDGTATAIDTFSTGSFGPHPEDTELGGADDITAFAGTEQGGYTVIEFVRALDTGDSYDKPLAPGANKIIWAYGKSDNVDDKHSTRGYGEVVLE
ncbi:MAG: PQQ-binding-like beta-propeller repeat protein [Dehalococcoidia bacterium]|nr:PQQ-binding-like beta-propeller repeat protein [Dehalococcoidia bacterium]